MGEEGIAGEEGVGAECVFGENEGQCGWSRDVWPCGGLWLLLTRVLGLLNKHQWIRGWTGNSGEF